MFYVFGIIFGFAWGGAGVQASTMVAELFGLKSHGVLLGVSSVGFSIGGSIGPILLGYIFDIASNYQLGFLILSIVNLIGLMLALLLQPVRKVEATQTSQT
jgi:MFS family permease